MNVHVDDSRTWRVLEYAALWTEVGDSPISSNALANAFLRDRLEHGISVNGYATIELYNDHRRTLVRSLTQCRGAFHGHALAFGFWVKLNFDKSVCDLFLQSGPNDSTLSWDRLCGMVQQRFEIDEPLDLIRPPTKPSLTAVRTGKFQCRVPYFGCVDNEVSSVLSGYVGASTNDIAMKADCDFVDWLRNRGIELQIDRTPHSPPYQRDYIFPVTVERILRRSLLFSSKLAEAKMSGPAFSLVAMHDQHCISADQDVFDAIVEGLARTSCRPSNFVIHALCESMSHSYGLRLDQCLQSD